MGSPVSFAAGARLSIRGAEWLVRRVDRTSSGGQSLLCVGLSELVKDKEATFLTEVEERFGSKITALDPRNTSFEQDLSANYRNSLLFIESLLRQTPPTDASICIGHRAAMDVLRTSLCQLRWHWPSHVSAF